jgi:thiol-disulfide isomerase/thioredoxin
MGTITTWISMGAVWFMQLGSAPGVPTDAGIAEQEPARLQAAAAEEVSLVPLTFSEFRARLAANASQSRYTMVDLWASNCAPCKENFPHLVEMNKKYRPMGLAVVSASLDDREDTKAIQSARAFLKEQRAVFSNYLIDEDFGVAYEKFEIMAIPAVILYGPDGKELKRFTLDDPNNQFTYEQVEEFVAKLLETKPADVAGVPDPGGR